MLGCKRARDDSTPSHRSDIEAKYAILKEQADSFKQILDMYQTVKTRLESQASELEKLTCDSRYPILSKQIAKKQQHTRRAIDLVDRVYENTIQCIYIGCIRKKCIDRRRFRLTDEEVKILHFFADTLSCEILFH